MANTSWTSHKKKRLSIRVKWIFLICTSILIALVGTVLFTHYTVSGILQKDNTSANKENARNAAAQVDLNLKNYENSLEQLAELTAANMKTANSMPLIDKSIEALQKNNKTLISVYFMDFHTGKLHISPYVEFNKDVRETRTYKDLTKKTKTIWMDVYKDTVSNKIMTSVVTPVLSDGKMVGAVGYDIDLSSIGAARQNIENESNSKLVILDAQGFIVSSFMKNTDGKNMNPVKSGSVEGVTDLLSNAKTFKSKFGWVEGIYKNSNSRSQSFSWQGKDYSGQITTIPSLNWKVLSFKPNEIFAEKMNQIRNTGIFSILIGLLLGAVIAVLLAEKLKKMIAGFQSVLKKTSEGDLVTEMNVPSNDEMGDLAKSYNDMLGNIRRLIQKVDDNVKSVNQATSGLKVIANENSAAISEVSRSIEEIAAGAGNQSEEIERGSNAVHELSSEIEELIKQSASIELVVGDAASQIKMGNEQVDNLEESYRKLEAAFDQVTGMISQLDDKSKSISKVSYAISQIAEQTNLLSLNASIEAARAGEHGKGFSVVANEVRNLAEESKKAANDIQVIINSVLKDTKELVNVMAETNQISFEQKGAVTTVSTSINQMTASLNKMMQSVEEETASISMIQVQKETVVRMIEEVSAVSQQTTASSEEIAAAMEEHAPHPVKLLNIQPS
ncbi:methyl-accepting chemotaxis protein [Neobacillus sp. PS3-34]|uniref:methyl-accepting chemotaxis protein n=1 Tax=Neobacillus sp. PS3-34 TaxID=3070678 RepID=UPI0027E11961|nr:methyl-accepting chemotaxis protein [Neobacillus sp. PS3-34]WML49918.1 methyl-accepting chemotaxis protein [Neobacillus sp. PS3-34]